MFVVSNNHSCYDIYSKINVQGKIGKKREYEIENRKYQQQQIGDNLKTYCASTVC